MRWQDGDAGHARAANLRAAWHGELEGDDVGRAHDLFPVERGQAALELEEIPLPLEELSGWPGRVEGMLKNTQILRQFRQGYRPDRVARVHGGLRTLCATVMA